MTPQVWPSVLTCSCGDLQGSQAAVGDPGWGQAISRYLAISRDIWGKTS